MSNTFASIICISMEWSMINEAYLRNLFRSIWLKSSLCGDKTLLNQKTLRENTLGLAVQLLRIESIQLLNSK